MNDMPVIRAPRYDAAGRPLEGRRRQAVLALAIVAGWVVAMAALLALTAGGGAAVRVGSLGALAVAIWIATEWVGTRRGLVWPASALAVSGALTLGYLAIAAAPPAAKATPAAAVAVIAGTAAAGMAAYLVRFRLPGLVSPMITFSIAAAFLAVLGPDGLSRVEGLSARGILAALIGTPEVAGPTGLAALAAMFWARRLDLRGGEFGIASARPLHLIGAGVAALVAGRAAGALPWAAELAVLVALSVAAFAWAIRINRVGVLLAIHLAIGKPLALAVLAPAGVVPGWQGWTALFLAAIVADLALWLPLHQMSLARGWTLGPGGRAPRPRAGWIWRYWPYA